MPEKFNLQQHVTNQIIEALEKGVPPWTRGWKSKNADSLGMPPLPINLSSKKKYRGINILLLWDAQEKGSFESRYWVTYKQAQELGGTVKQGEKSTMVGYYSSINPCEEHKKNVVADCATCEPRGFWKYYRVFNTDQCEGLKVPSQTITPVVVDSRELTPNEMGEMILKASGAKIEHRSILKSPHYNIGTDKIVLPHQAQFIDDDNYYRTALHELTHWTGAAHRLKRDFANRFGTKAYAFEELVAELGSAFLCAEIGVMGLLEKHAAYIDGWLDVLKRDKGAIFTAASKASDAFEYLLAYLENSSSATEVA